MCKLLPPTPYGAEHWSEALSIGISKVYPFFLFEVDATPHTTYYFLLRLVSNIKISEGNLVLHMVREGLKTTSNHQEAKFPHIAHTGTLKDSIL